ncbi:MAG: ShlB/FhaC/HecB family hemolysin secretion/activation protein [Burkholderiales bacterium]
MRRTDALVCGALALVAWQAHAQPAKPAVLPRELTDQIRFTIAEIRVEGNALVPAEPLLDAVKPFLGSGRRLEDLNGARHAIVEAYRSRGYELLSVDYDARRSRNGIHYFVVHEVRIGKVGVTGQQALTEAQVRRELPSLREGETPRLDRIARELFLFNDNPGRNAQLEYAAGAPGTTDVAIKVAEQPQLRAGLTYNNTGTNATGTSRLGFNVSHANLFERSHQLSAYAITSDRPGNMIQAGFGYSVPLPAWGDSLSFNASYSDVDSGRVADLFNVAGKSSIWGAHYQRNLARAAASRHVLDIGYDARRYEDLIDSEGVNLGTSVTVKPVSAGYRYNSIGAGSGLSLGVTLQVNIPGGRLNNDAAYAAARAGADAHWRYWQLDGSWQREFSSDWSVLARVAGQYANEPLVSAEQFGLGGQRAVRGFRERDGAGDRGLRANLELYGPRFGEGQRLLGFFDFGNSTRLDSQPGEIAKQGVASVGMGWRSQFKNGFQAAVDYAYVINGTPQNPKGDQMLHVSAAWWF